MGAGGRACAGGGAGAGGCSGRAGAGGRVRRRRGGAGRVEGPASAGGRWCYGLRVAMGAGRGGSERGCARGTADHQGRGSVAGSRRRQGPPAAQPAALAPRSILLTPQLLTSKTRAGTRPQGSYEGLRAWGIGQLVRLGAAGPGKGKADKAAKDGKVRGSGSGQTLAPPSLLFPPLSMPRLAGTAGSPALPVSDHPFCASLCPLNRT